MESQLKPVLLNLVAAFLGAFGQYLYKSGAKKLHLSSLPINWEIAVGMLFFVGVMGLFITAFKMGGNISVTYPVYSLTFIIGILLGVFLDKEPWHYMQLVGTFIIVAGIMLVVFYSPEA